MTRGRKKDLSIPPTRALTQQRDYRARKAHYLTELEERCRRAEEENEQLKQEIQALRAGLPITPSPLDPQLILACIYLPSV
ncbi:basic region leucin zipper protein [Lentinula edodes]|uniref:Basic region leucin zipper protein n=1 Tax=Lentinula edodes TaxID=5353 RepID=A0A1Q3EGB7_LENED|nr:basic region leucin zipper protein [Lentinula edodes]